MTGNKVARIGNMSYQILPLDEEEQSTLGTGYPICQKIGTAMIFFLKYESECGVNREESMGRALKVLSPLWLLQVTQIFIHNLPNIN